MDIIYARELLRSLADGIDPTTGECLPNQSPYNSPEIIRALFTLLEVTQPKSTEKPAQNRNAGKPWTEIEDEKLRDEFAAGLKISAIAREHGRSRGAIESRLERLNLMKMAFIFQENTSKTT